MNFSEIINTLESALEQNQLNPLEQEIQTYLDMNRDAINKLHPLDCGEISIRITQYSIQLKKYCNDIKAKINWIKSFTRASICDKTRNYSGSWENVDGICIKQDDVLTQLNNIKMKLEKRFDELDGLTFLLNNFSDNFRNLGYLKKTELKENSNAS